MIEVRLNENEQKIVEYIAKKRHSSARENGFDDKQISDDSKYEIDLDGFGGEFAVCKEFNVMPSFVTGKTDKADFALPSGTTVDVKTTKHKHGCLLVTIGKKVEDVDIYCLVVKITDELFNIIGWKSSKDVICKDAYNRHQRNSKFNGEGYCVYQEDLNKV